MTMQQHSGRELGRVGKRPMKVVARETRGGEGRQRAPAGRAGSRPGAFNKTHVAGSGKFSRQTFQKPSVPQQFSDDDDDVESDDMALDQADHAADQDDDDDELTAQQKQLADIPFEVLEVLRQDGGGLVGHAARQAARAAEDKQRDMHRANRHRPSEMSSKKPVSRFRDVIQVTKRESMDPRFESTTPGGHHTAAGPSSHAGSSYAFLYDDVIPQEQKDIKKRLKKEKNPKFKARLQGQLTALEQAVRSEEARKKRAKLDHDFKSTERQAVASGKKPFYLKKSEQRRLELVAKYEELKTQGRLDKFMEKRRRKNAAKDHRYVPSQRRPAAS